jgi:branched-chain amino acid transport system substrate-binding protein
MSSPVSDDNADFELNKYVPKRYREQSTTPEAEQPPYVTSASTAPWSAEMRRDRRTRSEPWLEQTATPGADRPPYVTSASAGRWPAEVRQDRRTKYDLWPEAIPEPPVEREGRLLALIGRVTFVAGFAAVVALLVVFGKPLLDGVRPLLNWDSQAGQVSKSIDRLAANDVLANRAVVPATTVAAVAGGVPPPSVQARQAPVAPGQQASLSPIAIPLGEQRSVNGTVRGVTDSEIRFGISAPFSGPAKELGQHMKLGIEAAFNLANANGGIYGRQLRLIAADDGYEPARTAATMKQLYDRDQVFGLVGNVGTPTAVVALPYALDRKILFFGAFTGAGLLRNDPPDRYVFNYRASYAEETAAVVNYLVKVRRLLPEQIAVFAQQDAYGDAGFAGVEKAIRSLRGGNDTPILRLDYQRNTVDVGDAVAQLQQKRRIPIKAIIMVPTYRAAAKFIEKTRDLYPDMIYTSVSFVGSTALADELMLLGKKYATGVIVTQVVPAVDGHSSLVLDYKSALGKYFPGEAPDYVSLEGYVDANVLIAALQRNGAQLDTERLVGTLENLRDLDIGLGTPVTFSRSEHQGLHRVWGTQLDETGHYQPLELQ